MELDTFTTDDAINAATFHDDGLSWLESQEGEAEYARV